MKIRGNFQVEHKRLNPLINRSGLAKYSCRTIIGCYTFFINSWAYSKSTDSAVLLSASILIVHVATISKKTGHLSCIIM